MLRVNESIWLTRISQLHMHVISKDFNSESLKNKKHWNSFTTEFFIDAQKAIQMLTTEGKIQVKFVGWLMD
jgi:aprataxin